MPRHVLGLRATEAGDTGRIRPVSARHEADSGDGVEGRMGCVKGA